MNKCYKNSWTISALALPRKHVWFATCVTQFMLIILIFSCQDKEPSEEGIMERIPIDVENYQSIDQMDFRDVEAIPLSSKEEFLFESVGKILFANDLIFIRPMKQQRILVFNEKGEGVRIIDHQGKGPGEFLFISDFEIDTVHQRIVVTDPANKKLVLYSLEGDFIEDRQLNNNIFLFKIIYCPDQTIHYALDVAYARLRADSLPSYSFLLQDNEGNTVNSYFPFDKPKAGFNGDLSKLFTQNTSIKGYYKCFTDTIFRIDCDGIKPQYLLNFDQSLISYQDFVDNMGKNSLKDQDIVIDVMYAEDASHVYIEYSYHLEKYIAMYYKDQQIVRNFKIEQEEGCFRSEWFPIVTTVEGKMVFTGGPNSAPCLQKLFGKASGTEKLYNTIAAMSDNDNPVLVLATMGL